METAAVDLARHSKARSATHLISSPLQLCSISCPPIGLIVSSRRSSLQCPILCSPRASRVASCWRRRSPRRDDTRRLQSPPAHRQGVRTGIGPEVPCAPHLVPPTLASRWRGSRRLAFGREDRDKIELELLAGCRPRPGNGVAFVESSPRMKVRQASGGGASGSASVTSISWPVRPGAAEPEIAVEQHLVAQDMGEGVGPQRLVAV